MGIEPTYHYANAGNTRIIQLVSNSCRIYSGSELLDFLKGITI